MSSEPQNTENSTFHHTWPAQGARRFGLVNWVGLWTLYLREVRRFWKVVFQTVGAPVVTTLLFLAIFSLALGGLRPDIGGTPFTSYLAPGLVIMAMLQNAFANTSSSLLIGKVQGNVVDILMPPLSAGELTTAIALGGLTRGLVVGVFTFLGMTFFVDFTLSNIWAVLYFAVSGSLLMSFMGMLVGIWAEKFDHMQAITNFIITPLTFLSGTFYSVEQLPEPAQVFSSFNPFFYMIDGFRYGFIGQPEGNLVVGVLLLAALNIILWVSCYIMFDRGYRIKA
ncbi:MAG: multidrug ABC transporter permease [PS1 clade bacterium]|uniref:Transport permease protein n=1 Tax=PS1 clade bacterium TaxID=2175152 RepID=A0A368DUK4_9PROT|nr:MAG: multidrug ABC transporter permease [PS1 clade bacterium]HCV49551.1 multidrug ABC transporter permease [Rhodobiaceae bacterium]|tara:strand:+ start:168 stop:1010 length:843 start_codon:yes stop_codon:yes gene_type:complete